MNNDEQRPDDDQDLFRQAVQGVAPVDAPAVPRENGVAKELTPGQVARREAAVAQGKAGDPNHLNYHDVASVAPLEWVEYHKDGVQHGVLKKLRQGGYDVLDTLDLHGKTLREARHELYWFLQRSVARSLRMVSVAHGKGVQSETPGRMKSHVVHWLKQVPDVIAFASALPRHGGTGALYVLLRKSEPDRVENRERHGRKGRLEHT